MAMNYSRCAPVAYGTARPFSLRLGLTFGGVQQSPFGVADSFQADALATSPIPLLPTELGQISTRLLRFDVSYYDDTRLGDIYDGPRWSYEGNRDDSFDRFDDRYDPRYDSYDDRFERRRREGFDDRFNDQSPDRFEPRDRPLKAPYDERYDWKNDGVNPPRSAPRSSPPDRRSPYRKGASPTTLFAENGRSPEKDSASESRVESANTRRRSPSIGASARRPNGTKRPSHDRLAL